MRITDRAVEEACCPEGRKDQLLFDDAVKGFGVRVTASGKKIFIVQYRVGKAVRRLVLGEFRSELTTAQARKKAESARGKVIDKRDPVAEIKVRRAETVVLEAQAKAEAARDAYTVDALITDWATHHLATRSLSYRTRVPVELRRALKIWVNTSAETLTRIDAVRVLDSVKGKNGPIAANRLRAEARACWRWAVKRGAMVSNPWELTPRPMARESARARVLSDDEIGHLYNAAGKLEAPWMVLVRLLILTGQRRSEVGGMRWEELDLDRSLWSMPGVRTKNKHPHTVPLSAEAVELLRSVEHRKDAEFVFEGPRQTAVSGFGKLKLRLTKALDEALKPTGRASVPWVIHDLRRTLATGFQKLGVRLEVTEAVLNHVSGSRSGIVGVYQRHGWDREKAEALKSWTAHVIGVANGKAEGDNVIQLRLGT